MIELLMVIVIIAILGAAAVPQFIDFRNEARAAVVQQMLSAMRVGIKNQIQQARLKCGSTGDPNNNTGATFFYRLGAHIEYNNITAFENDPLLKICSSSEVPNESDQLFWTFSDSQRPLRSSGGPGEPKEIFVNPFVTPNPLAFSYPVWEMDNADVVSPGICNLASTLQSFLGIKVHWFYNFETGEIFAGTNTPGIDECSF